jgi:diguanylate cyclase (GGDEF)-like protein
LEHWLQRVHPEDRERVEDELEPYRRGEAAASRSEHRIQHVNGEWKWILARGLIEWDGRGVASRMAGTLVDVTAGKTADPLTGIPNRLSLLDHLEQRIERGRTTQNWNFAVFFVDIDSFKIANDSLGHRGGDALLAEAAHRLTRLMHGISQSSLVARNGSDEFLVLAEDIKNEDAANGLSTLFEASLRAPFDFHGRRTTLSVSIGFALADCSCCVHPEDLIAYAEMAMSQAKLQGGDRVVAFTSGLRERPSGRRQMEEDLR